MADAFISVIIPVHNVAGYLSQCIESVVRQSYQNLEIILVDDGSDDGSGRICDEWAADDSRAKVIHQEYQGVSGARNTGLEHAAGEYICWVDSDDYASDHLVEYLYSFIIKYQAEMAVCGYVRGDDREHHFEESFSDAAVQTPEEMFDCLYDKGKDTFTVNASWAKLIRKDLYQGIRYPAGRIFEDIYVTYQLIGKCRRIALSDAKLYYYFKRSDSIMGSSFSEAKLDYLGALETRIAYFRQQDMLELSEKARIQYLHFLIWEFSRSKDILHKKDLAKGIVEQYRKYYKEGDSNPFAEHETQRFMHDFYKNPYLLDFRQKVKAKFGKQES